ncbi:MAG: septal ring lytic transglycosylase RlpA family protein [Burkholderiaceae bacterium]
MTKKNKTSLTIFLPITLSLIFWIPVHAEEKAPCIDHENATKCAPGDAKKLDRTGKARKGKASYYGREFYGKKMANGKPMNPQSNVAASKTLPLGTKAEVTNLETGKSAVVDVQDRGPYAKGRIVDVSPKVAEKLDIKEKGVAPVEVKPIAIPPEDKSLKAKAP